MASVTMPNGEVMLRISAATYRKSCTSVQHWTMIGSTTYPQIVRYHSNNWLCDALPYGRGYAMRLPIVADYIPVTH